MIPWSLNISVLYETCHFVIGNLLELFS